LKNKKLWNEGCKYIAGGNMLFSKRPDLYLPDKWPPYYLKAKGCEIIGMDKKKYIDTSMMGIGTNVLGYANKEVDDEVIKEIKNSNMSTLNSYHEVQLAKKLIQLHPWSSKVKFARSGGEANSIAIRIARVVKKNSPIAVCGYHGWHDWYLALNKKNNKKQFNEYLMKGIPEEGIPKELSKYIYPFFYNNLDTLKFLIKKKRVRIIKMEVRRNILPKNNFLIKVKRLCEKNNCILIFDECTSGFRQTLGGLHKFYKVNPDICIFGKAIGNGFPLTAILGTEKVMKNVSKTFISSTFWTERTGSVAALKTIEIMERDKTWKTILKTSRKIKSEWMRIAKKNKIKIEIFGIESILKFKFLSENNFIYKSIITEKMLEKGYLANTAFYISIAHTDKILKNYFFHLNNIFKIIKKIEDGDNYKKYFKSKFPLSEFTRFN